MTPLKLYLLRAVHDWAVNSSYTPQVLVNTTAEGVKVPPGYAENGRIILNTHPAAVSHFEFSADGLRFSARFGAQSFRVVIPYPAVLAIYARENNQGISFPVTSAEINTESGVDDRRPEDEPPGKGPILRVVK